MKTAISRSDGKRHDKQNWHGPLALPVLKNFRQKKILQADTVLYALGMKSVPYQELESAAKAADILVQVIGDAIRPGKVDRATRTGCLAGYTNCVLGQYLRCLPSLRERQAPADPDAPVPS